MSRSFKKSPHMSYCKGPKGSDKFDKQLAHAAFRRRERIALHTENYDALPVKITEARDVYDFVSDGPKHYRKDLDKKWMRK
ncbi:MAG: hypothetical protein Q8916_04070 [Bacteroidota bacterium]|nr:hypothetical protein [Bacteroidota bacterium]MDP4235098.1 hypothetical protein [Bacteroidota bacterium]